VTRPAVRPTERVGPRPSTGTYRLRRLIAALVVLGVLVGAGFGVRALLNSGLADVRDVRITGLTTIRAAAVQRAAAVTTGGPLADVDTAAIAARVAALPAVATASVSRSWPHTVTVSVVERVPVATVTTPKGVALVDSGGVAYPGTPPPGLPRLDFGGVGPDDPATRAAVAALAALPDAVRRQVLTVGVVVTGAAPGQVGFGLTDDRQVLWGTAERAADKAAVIVPLLTQPGHVFDVTSPDLPTIRR
jgi:cell division protein FtsQ